MSPPTIMENSHYVSRVALRGTRCIFSVHGAFKYILGASEPVEYLRYGVHPTNIGGEATRELGDTLVAH